MVHKKVEHTCFT